LIGPQQLPWLERLEDELDNFRAALRWTLDAGAPAVALRTAGALWMFWWTHSHYREGRRWLEEALAQAETDGATTPRARAKALNALGLLLQSLGATAASEPVFSESLALFRQAGDAWWEAEVLINLAVSTHHEGQYDRARQLLEQSLGIGPDAGASWLQGRAIHNLGAVAMSQGHFEQAESFIRQSQALMDPAAKTMLRLRNTLLLGILHRAQGDYPAAAGLLRQTVALATVFRDQDTVADCLEEGAFVAAAQGQAARTARLGGAAEGARQETGQRRSPVEQQEFADNLAPARALLSPDAWEQAWAAGLALSSDAAVALLLRGGPDG
jgi:tetratricopeptide (TPR) repeat protein